MKLEKRILLSEYFENYKPIMKEKYQIVLKYYLEDDLSLTEIGENLEMSKQGVQRILQTGIKELEFYEAKLELTKIKKQLGE